MIPLMAQFEFASPQRLSALAIVLVVLLAGIFSRTRHSRGRRLAMALGRTLAVAALVLAWAGLFWRGPTSQTFVVLLDDQSDSAVKTDATEELPIDYDARLQFGGNTATAASAMDRRQNVAQNRRGLEPLASDLGLAVCRAAAIVPEERVGHIVLHSDGRETREGLVAAAQAQGLPVHVMVKAPFPEPEACIAEVAAPQSARPGASFSVEVLVTANHEDAGKLELHGGGDAPQVRAVQLKAGTNRIPFSATFPDGQTTLTLRGEISGCRDTYTANNIRRAVVTAAARPRVLLVEEGPGQGAISKAMQVQGFDVTSATAAQIPAARTSLARFDAVVLSDVAAGRVGEPQRDAVARFVRDGGGLIAWGGERMLSPPALAGSWLEKLLPLSAAEVPPPRKRTLALVLVIDKSHSMLEERRLELAKEAARRTVNLDVIGPDDEVAVLAFGDDSQWISPLAASGDKQKLLAAIDTLQAAGATNMAPAMQRARLALVESNADRRHVILLSDGVSSPGDFSRIAREMAAAGITVSTVSVSQGADQTILRDIARVAGGRHYHCDDPKEVPQILEQETRSTAQPVAADPFRPLVYRKLPRLDLSAAPPLAGYVPLNPKPGAELLLITPDGDPLLAWWDTGRGKVVMMAADLSGRAGAEWRSWSGFDTFLARLVQHVSPIRQPQYRVTTKRRFDRLRVNVEPNDPAAGPPQAGGELAIVFEDPSGLRASPVAQSLHNSGDGKYVADIRAGRLGTYHLRVRIGQSENRFEQRLAVAIDYPDELILGPADEKLLAEAAEASGGQVITDPTRGIPPDGRTVPCRIRLWPPLVMLALVLLTVEIVLRRWRQNTTTLQPPDGAAAWCDRPMRVP